MIGLLEAKRALIGGTVVVMATVLLDPIIAGHPLMRVRIIQIKRQHGIYYGKTIGTGLWYPISSVEVIR